tara:strand:- start:365 stop:631 length:267 start_codon:yes stop_codon:yes gene_type:complete
MKKNTKTRATAKNYILLIVNDNCFDKNHEDYLGFINIDPNEAIELKGPDYRDVAIQIAMNPTQFESTFNTYGLTIESAYETELVITEI